MRNKGAVKKKIAEKEEAERKRMEEEEQKVSFSLFSPTICPVCFRFKLTCMTLNARDNDPNARRARTRAAEIAADMDSAATLFGASSLNGRSRALTILLHLEFNH